MAESIAPKSDTPNRHAHRTLNGRGSWWPTAAMRSGRESWPARSRAQVPVSANAAAARLFEVWVRLDTHGFDGHYDEAAAIRRFSGGKRRRCPGGRGPGCAKGCDRASCGDGTRRSRAGEPGRGLERPALSRLAAVRVPAGPHNLAASPNTDYVAVTSPRPLAGPPRAPALAVPARCAGRRRSGRQLMASDGGFSMSGSPRQARTNASVVEGASGPTR